MSAYVADVAALARKDLLLELRARDAAGDAPLRRLDARRSSSSRCRRAHPTRRERPALDRDPLHRAARPDARVRAPSGSRACSTRSCSRRATGARSGSARRSATGVPRRSRRPSRCPRSRSSSTGSRGSPSRRSRSPTSASAPSARSSPRWPSPAARASCSCRSSSCRSRSRSWSAASARRVGDDPARYLGFLALYDAIFAILCLGEL